VGAVVPAVDGRPDLAGEFFDAAERAAVDGLAFDDAEPDFEEVEPRAGCWGEVDLDPWVDLQPGTDLYAFVGGVVVHHQVQLMVWVVMTAALRIARRFPPTRPDAAEKTQVPARLYAQKLSIRSEPSLDTTALSGEAGPHDIRGPRRRRAAALHKEPHRCPILS
jgi:hypothetical protein